MNILFFTFFSFSFDTEYNPVGNRIEKRTNDLKQRKIDPLKATKSNLKNLKFIPEINNPIEFIKSFSECFNGCDVDLSTIVPFIPQTDLINFTEFILNDNFKSLKTKFIELYLPKYIELVQKEIGKSLDNFDSIEEFIVFKCNFYETKMCLSKEKAISLVVYQLPYNICEKLVLLGGLESLEKLILLARTLDTEIESRYIKSVSEQVNVSLVDLARKKKEDLSSPFSYFKSISNSYSCKKNGNNKQQTASPKNSINKSNQRPQKRRRKSAQELYNMQIDNTELPDYVDSEKEEIPADKLSKNLKRIKI